MAAPNIKYESKKKKSTLVYRISLFGWIVQNLVTAENLFYLKYLFSTHGSLLPSVAAPLAPAP